MTAADPDPETRGYHHGNLRRALLEATIDTVARHGVAAVKVSTLAKELGVSSGAPFRHFRSRHDLLVAAAELAVERSLRAMEHAADGLEDPVEAQRAQGVAYVRWTLEDPGAFQLLCRKELIDSSPSIQAAGATFREGLDAILGRGRTGVSTSSLVRRTAGGLAAQALVYGLAKMISDGVLGELTPEQAERLAWEATGVLGEGLAGPAGEGTSRD